MSEHPGEAQRHLNKIHVADDVWFDVFPLLSHAKLGLKLALITDHFDRLVDENLGRMKWKMSSDHSMQLNQQNEKFKHHDGVRTTVELPLAQTPPLKGIIGFNKITIGYIDRAVINFVRHLANFDITLQLEISPTEQRSWHIFAHEIWPFLNNTLVPPFCATVPISDLLNASACCLNSRRMALRLAKHWPNGYARRFKMADLKNAFSTATTPVNFIINMPWRVLVVVVVVVVNRLSTSVADGREAMDGIGIGKLGLPFLITSIPITLLFRLNDLNIDAGTLSAIGQQMKMNEACRQMRWLTSCFLCLQFVLCFKRSRK
uniref:Uncharacterized protein n=1 Tax=Globodera rostochiensis TaxID=31243 RepID=A0A914HFG4_GLORO